MFIDWVVRSVFVHSEFTRTISFRKYIEGGTRLALGPIGQ